MSEANATISWLREAIEKLKSDLLKERIVNDNLGKISDSQAEKIVEMEEQIENLQARIKHLDDLNYFDATRLRTLAAKCGIAVPESDEELSQVIGVVLGSIRRVVDRLCETNEQHDQQVRDEAYEKAAIVGGRAAETMSDGTARRWADGLCVADAIRNLKGTK